MAEESDIDKYLKNSKAIWQKIQQYYQKEPIEIQAIVFERMLSPFVYWIEDQKEFKTADEMLNQLIAKYNLEKKEDKIYPKDELTPLDFSTVANELEKFGYEYQRGKRYFLKKEKSEKK